MPIKYEPIHEGIRLTHPSGLITITTLGNLKKLRLHALEMIDFLSGQLKLVDEQIEKVDAYHREHTIVHQDNP